MRTAVIDTTHLRADERVDIRRDVTRMWLALLMLAIALFANQYVTLRRFKAVLLSRDTGAPITGLADKVWDLLLHDWTAILGWPDLAIAAAILLAVGYIIRAEVNRGTLTTLLSGAETSNAVLFGFLGLLSLVITRSYLNPGEVFMGDADTHTLRSWMVAENLKQLEMPVWSNAWYGGFPLLEHYAPLYFVATAVLTLLFGDIHLATKLLLWLCHVGSIFAMFLFLREVTRRTLPALVGGLAYGLSFFRLHIILYQGDLQVAVLFLIYPVILLLCERFLQGRVNARRTFVLVTLALAVMILNHHGYAFFGLVLMGVYLAARLAATPGDVRGRLMLLLFFGCTQIAALAISAFLLVPFIFDVNDIRGMPNTAFPILVPNPWAPLLLLKLFRWSAMGDGTTVGYIGLSIGLLAAIGSLFAARQRIPPAVGLIAGAAAALFMVRNQVQYNVKNIYFFLVFVSALSAWALIAMQELSIRVPALERSRRRWQERFPARLSVALLGLLLLDLGASTFQSVYREGYGFKQEMYKRLAADSGGYKVIERQIRRHDPSQDPGSAFEPHRLGIPSAYAGLQSPLGFFHEGAGKSFGYNAEMVKQLHLDLNEGQLSELSATGLYLMGVKHVIFRDRYQWFTPVLEPSARFTVDRGVLTLAHATPLIASTRVITVGDVEGYPAAGVIEARRYFDPQTFDYTGRYFRELVLPLITTMGVDVERATADVLIARDERIRTSSSGPATLEMNIRRFSAGLKHVEVAYHSNSDSVGRLAYTYFPYLDVRVDGTPVEFYRSAMNYLLVRLPAGEHVVTVRGVAPPMQEWMGWFSAAAFIAVIGAPRRLFGGVEAAHLNSLS